jgi:hypothetical protein
MSILVTSDVDAPTALGDRQARDVLGGGIPDDNGPRLAVASLRRRRTVLVINLIGVAMVVLALVARRKREGLAPLVLLAVMALQLGCTTDAPSRAGDHANGPTADMEPGAGGDPQDSLNEEPDDPDSWSEPADSTGCPDPATCGDPNSNPDAGTN